MEQNKFNATHPGEVIKDELISRGISQKDFARHIGVPYTMLNDILNERRPLSAVIALYVETALGISAELLMGLQSDYTMQKSRANDEIKRKLSRVVPYQQSAVPAAVTGS